MDKPIVSIIIPVYNTKDYLVKCIESVLNQTLKDIEVICIDDGSNDGSAELLDAYAKRDNRIRVMHKGHLGLVAARREGIFAAQSKYIGFVDSDDWIEPPMYEELFEFAEKGQVDCVFSNIYMENREPWAEHNRFQKKIYREIELGEIYSHLLDDDFCSPHTVAKIYKRDILRATCIGIDERIHFGEDDCLVYSYLIECKSVGFMNKEYYHCVNREGSDSKTYDGSFVMNMNIIFLFLKARFEKSPYRDILLPQLEFYFVKRILYGIRYQYELEISNYFEADFIFREPKSVVIYGAGTRGKKLIRMIKKGSTVELVGVVDKNLVGEMIEEIRVSPIHDILKMQYDYVMITMKNADQADSVKKQLIQLGVQKDKIKFYYV